MNRLKLNIPSPLEELIDPIISEKEVSVYVKRDDLIHPYITGNKWRKLKKYIQIFEESQKKGILSFGGAYSNHIMALAFVGNLLNIPTIGIIRGHELNKNSNQQLQLIDSLGMKLIFISREDYKKKNIPIDLEWKDYLIIPEGGYSKIGVDSMRELAQELEKENATHIITAVGTGTTAIGLAKFLSSEIIGILSLKNKAEINKNEIKQLGQNKIELLEDYSEKSYGKFDIEINAFSEKFGLEKKIPVEKIYTGKMFYALFDLIQKDYFPKGSKIIAIHTGGVYPTDPSKEIANNF